MKQVFNYFYCPEDPLPNLDTPELVSDFCQRYGLDGIELMLYRELPSWEWWKGLSVGMHLPYWPCWLPLYYEEEEVLQSSFPRAGERLKYFEAADWPQFENNYKGFLKIANQVNPEYVVWHVADCTPQEAFSFRFQRTNKQVLQATVEFFKRNIDTLNPDIKVLFENLWWPGLTLRSLEDTAYFLDQLKDFNVGIMLDTGHLLNTTLQVHTEAEAVEFLINSVKQLGTYSSYIQGMHLNLSLSADYRAPFIQGNFKSVDRKAIGKHISSIDQHLPFTHTSLARLIKLIQPQYINHELGYRNTPELECCMEKQLRACGRSNMI